MQRKRIHAWTASIDGFNRGFERITGRYADVLNRIVARRVADFRHAGSRSVLASTSPARCCRRASSRARTRAPSTPSSRRRRAPRLETTNKVAQRAADRSARRSRGGVRLFPGRLRDHDRGPRLERRHLPDQPEALVGPAQGRERDHRGARASDQGPRCGHRVLRTARGARLRFIGRLLAAHARQDQRHGLPRVRADQQRVHGGACGSARN